MGLSLGSKRIAPKFTPHTEKTKTKTIFLKNEMSYKKYSRVISGINFHIYA